MPRFSPAPTIWIAAALLSLVAFSYRDVPSYSYTENDALTLLRVNRVESPPDVWRAFGREFRDEIQPGVRFYRPLTALSYAAQQGVTGIDPAPMHVVDVLLHGLSAVALFLLAWSLGLGIAWGALAGLLFALHPLGVEVVPALARRGDLLAVLLLLSSTLSRVRDHRWLAVALGMLAPLGKETAFVLPLVWAGCRRGDRRERVREALLGLSVVAPALLLRTLVLGGSGGYQRVVVNPEGALSSFLTLFDPFRLFGAVPSRALFALMLVALVLLAWRRRSAAIGFGAVWLLASFLLAMLGGRVSGWYLYASLPAVALLLSALLHGAFDAFRRLRYREAGLAALPGLALALCLLIPAPAWTSYPEWGEASRLLELWDRELMRHVDSGEMPEGEPVVLLGVPMHVGQGPGARFFTRTASVALGYTLRDGLLLRHGVELPIWCALQVHLHAVHGHYEILIEQRDGEIWVRGEGPVELEAADRLTVWREGGVPPYSLRRVPDEDALVFRGVVPPIWRWNGQELVRWPVPG